MQKGIDRNSQRAPRRRHRPGASHQAGPLEHQGTEFHRGARNVDGFRAQIDTHVDTMAERVVQLGGTALGTTQTVAAASKLAAYPTDIYNSKDHLGALAERYGTARIWCARRSTRPTKPATRTPRTSSPPIPARSTRRCGSSKRSSGARVSPPPHLGRFHLALARPRV